MSMIQNYPQGYIQAGTSSPVQSEVAQESTVVTEDVERTAYLSYLGRLKDKLSSVEQRVGRYKDKFSSGSSSEQDRIQYARYVQLREDLRKQIEDYKEAERKARTGEGYGVSRKEPTQTPLTTQPTPTISDRYTSQSTAERLGLVKNEQVGLLVDIGTFPGTKVSVMTSSGEIQSTPYYLQGGIERPTPEVQTKPIKQQEQEQLKSSYVPRTISPSETTLVNSYQIIGQSNLNRARDTYYASQFYEGTKVVKAGISEGFEFGGKTIGDIGTASLNVVSGFPNVLGISVERTTGVLDESGRRVTTVINPKASAEDYVYTGLTALSMNPTAGKFIISTFTAVGLYVEGKNIQENFGDPLEVSKSVGRIGFISLGAGSFKEVLNIRKFTGADVSIGTMKSVPSSVAEVYRSRQFLSERGITPRTFDTINRIDYAGVGENIKYEIMIVQEPRTGTSIELPVEISRETIFTSKKSVTPVFKTAKEGSPITDYIVESFPKVIETTEGTRTQNILAPTNPITAEITKFGLIPESTGTIPLIEVSKYPYQEAKISLTVNPSELRLSPVEYSAYLQRKYPERYKGIGLEAVNARGSAYQDTTTGEVFLEVNPEVLFQKKTVEPVSLFTVRDYAKRGEYIYSVLGKKRELSFDSTVAHELIHVEDFITGNLKGTEKRAFEFQVAFTEAGTSPEFIVSIPEKVFVKSTFINFPSQEKTFIEGLAKAEGSRTILTKFEGDVLATKFGKTFETSKQTTLIPIEESPKVIELDKGMKPLSLTSKEVKVIETKTSSSTPEITIQESFSLISEAPKALSPKTELALGKTSSPRVSREQKVLSGYQASSSSSPISSSRVRSIPIQERQLLYSRGSVRSDSKYRTDINVELKTVLETKSSIELKSLSEPTTILSLKYDLTNKNNLEPVTELRQKIGLEQKQSLEQKQILELKSGLQRGELKRGGRSLTTPPRPPTIEVPKPIYLPRKRKDDNRFKLLVRQRGKFRAVAVGDVDELSFKGQSILKETARASYKIQSETGETIQLNIPSGFIKSKREMGVIVQPRENRISSMGEKREITYAGIRSNAMRGGYKLKW